MWEMQYELHEFCNFEKTDFEFFREVSYFTGLILLVFIRDSNTLNLCCASI